MGLLKQERAQPGAAIERWRKSFAQDEGKEEQGAICAPSSPSVLCVCRCAEIDWTLRNTMSVRRGICCNHARKQRVLRRRTPSTSCEYTRPCAHNAANLNANPDIPITQPHDARFTKSPQCISPDQNEPQSAQLYFSCVHWSVLER